MDCFLVKNRSQLAKENKSGSFCVDCQG
ncbi:MAG: DUF4193 family protein [Microbacteriaceae bacterium]